MNGLQGTSRERNEFAARHFQDRAQRWTELYDDRDREAHGFLVRRDAVGQQLESVPRREGEQGVDLGCGSGPYLGGLSSRCVRVVGVDVAPAMIDEARRNLSSDVTNVDLVVASILDLPYPPDTFDVGVCVGVLEYFDDPGPCSDRRSEP